MSSSPTPRLLRLFTPLDGIPTRSIPIKPREFALGSPSAPISRNNRFKLLLNCHRCRSRSSRSLAAAAGEDFADIHPIFEEIDVVPGTDSSYIWSSSDGEESEVDLFLDPNREVDFPARRDRTETPDAALTVTAHRFATIHRGHRRRRSRQGVWNNVGLTAFIVSFLLFVDWCSWKIVRLPLESFFLTYPFSVATVLSACAGWIYIPLVDSMKIHQILRKEGPATHSTRQATPTMGGLFFIPIGVAVARVMAGSNSVQVSGTVLATLLFAAIGLLADILSWIKNHNYGLSGRTKFILQVTVGTLFSFWLDSTNMPTPYNMNFVIPFPPPFGLVCLGKSYLVLTAFCFASMGNGVNLTDGLDGLAGGTAALAFVGMAVAVLPICPELATFGASMAGACVGFLFHNRYRASIFMGDIGSLALGGALAAMASCTGMFFPLFISSGVFVLEVMSVIMQVLFVKVTRQLYGTAKRFFHMAPFHHHLELCGVKEPVIVSIAYVVSCIMTLCAGYVGLISV